MFGSKTQTLGPEKEETKNEKESNANKTYELPEVLKFKLGDCLANVLGAEGEEILENDFLQVKELEDKNIEKIEEEYEFHEIKYAFNEGVVPPQLNFLWW